MARASDRREQRTVAGLRLHPQAQLVPAMLPAEFTAFLADIAAHGIDQPLEITPGGEILDGRHRHQAALELGLETVPVRVVAADDPVAYMLRSALQRRQLSASQRAALALDLDNLRAERLVATLPPGRRVRELAAEIAGVCPRTIQDALTVQTHDPALFERIRAGEVPAHKARLQLQRANRYAQIGQAPPLPAGLFDLIYADPPWQMGNPDGPWSPEQHYPTLPLEEIKALPVPAAEDAVLFLWVPAGLIPQGLELIVTWGFTYRSQACWDKQAIGLGQWFRMQHEPLLFATRGKVSPPPPEQRASSLIQARRRGHSTKPTEVYELIEQMYPRARKIELYARASRPGWTAWGNQVQAAEEAA